MEGITRSRRTNCASCGMIVVLGTGDETSHKRFCKQQKVKLKLGTEAEGLVKLLSEYSSGDSVVEVPTNRLEMISISNVLDHVSDYLGSSRDFNKGITIQCYMYLSKSGQTKSVVGCVIVEKVNRFDKYA